MMPPLALDLFCGAGGASAGLADAGFEVHGVDIDLRGGDGAGIHNPVIRLGWRADILDIKPALLRHYDFVWASPPCQLFSSARRLSKSKQAAVNLIPQTRRLLAEAGVPAVMENVPGAPLRADFVLTGQKVGEPEMIRKRHFEFVNMRPPPPAPDTCARAADIVCLTGNGTPFAPKLVRCGYKKFVSLPRAEKLAWKRRAIGCEWMRWRECNQAVPRRYAAMIGMHALAHIGER